MQESAPHIAIIPTPGIGHLIPLTELARRLSNEFNFTITILIPNDGFPPSKSQLSILQTLPNTISHLFLSPVDLTDLHSDARIKTRIKLTLTRSLPAIRDSLRVLSESTRLVAVVVDLFGSDICDLAREIGILPYIFFLTSALGLCFGFSMQNLHNMHTCEFRDISDPVQFCPGSVPVHGADFPDAAQCRKNESYKFLLDMKERYSKAVGILVNSFFKLEPATFKYLMEDCHQDHDKIPPVYPIGPIIRTDLEGDLNGLNYLKWLDEQPSKSVLFVSFGSGGNLSHEQVIELALGLESSGQRFLWVVKTPHDKANASYFSINDFDDPLVYLPQGFLCRTKGLGLVVPSWAPQIQILSHGSTGGFVTHCGWNSVLESIVHGVPLIAWPLYAEQKLNSVLLAEDLKVALRVKPHEKGLIQRDQIAQYAQCLIQGEQGKLLRDNMRALNHEANIALNEDGSSKESLGKVVQAMMNHKIIGNGQMGVLN